MKIGFIIPEKFALSRFPGKPLHKIKGFLMLSKTNGQSAKAIRHKDLYVARDSKKILKFYKKNKIKFCLISNKYLTKTDRVVEFLKKVNFINYLLYMSRSYMLRNKKNIFLK